MILGAGRPTGFKATLSLENGYAPGMRRVQKNKQLLKRLCARYALRICVQGDYWQAAGSQDRAHEDRNKLLRIKKGYAPTYAPYIYIRKNEIFL